MHFNPRRFIPVLLVVVLLLVAAWYLTRTSLAAENGSLSASGSIEATEVIIGPEIGGKVAEVLVAEGDAVQAGDVLFRIDDALLQAQISQAQAALDAAKAGETAAEQGLTLAQAARDLAAAQQASAQAGQQVTQLQYQRTLNQALQAELPQRSEAWRQSTPGEFEQPVWYFDRAEKISAAQAEVDEATRIRDVEKSNYDKVLQDLDHADFLDIEHRLAEAEAAFLVAQTVLDRARGAQDGTQLVDYAEELFDAAKSDLDSAQKDYDSALSDTQAQDVLDARARFRVAQERLDAAQDRLRSLQTGSEALEVQVARASLSQAEQGVAQAGAALAQAEAAIPQAQSRLDQAKASVAQAQAGLDALLVQLDKLTVRAPTAGYILTRSIEPGELAQAGSAAIVLSNLDELTITVYLPEDRYGQVRLGDGATVTADPFPEDVFEATITRIADKAEFTPRNVQTAEGRRTTVFAIQLALKESDGKLKPGMPADVVFSR